MVEEYCWATTQASVRSGSSVLELLLQLDSLARVCVRVCVYIYMCVCIYVCVYIYVYICVYIYTYIYMADQLQTRFLLAPYFSERTYCVSVGVPVQPD